MLLVGVITHKRRGGVNTHGRRRLSLRNGDSGGGGSVREHMHTHSQTARRRRRRSRAGSGHVQRRAATPHTAHTLSTRTRNTRGTHSAQFAGRARLPRAARTLGVETSSAGGGGCWRCRRLDASRRALHLLGAATRGRGRVSRESGVCGRDHSGCRCAGECAGGGRARAAAGEAALASGAGPLGVRCCCMFV